jgi:hypothetical protein
MGWLTVVAKSADEEVRKGLEAADPDLFFAQTPPPAGFDETQRSVTEWMQTHIAAGRRVALVTVRWPLW